MLHLKSFSETGECQDYVLNYYPMRGTMLDVENLQVSINKLK